MGIIGSIRKHSWIAVTIVGIAIIAFIIGDLTKRGGGKDTVVAEVNGETLKRSQFENLVEQEVNYSKMVRSYATGDATLYPSEERSIRDSIWANYLDDVVLGEQFEKLGLEVSEAEMTDMATGTFIHPWFASNPELYDNGQYSRAKAGSMVKAYSSSNNAMQRMGWEKSMDLVKKDRLRQKYVTLVTSGFYMPKPIAKQIAAYTAQGATVSVVSMPYAQVADNEVKLTDADYQKYYNKHKEEFRNMNEEMRVLEYVAFNITPNDKDYATAQDSAMVIWNKLQSTPDSMSRALDIMIRKYSKDVARYSYDSTCNRYLPASYFPATFKEMVEASGVGSEIAPVLVDNNKWFMGRVMGIENRPDSIRTSVIYLFANNQRDSVRTAALADSLMTELNAGRLVFDTAVAKYCDVKIRMSQNDSTGDMGWKSEGNLDKVYNDVLDQLLRTQGLTWFKGVNDQLVATPKGGQVLITFPEHAGYAIVKVTDKSELVKKYRLAMIVQKIKASQETMNGIQTAANEFLSKCNNGKDFDKAVSEFRKEPGTIQVYRTSNRVVLGQVMHEGVNKVSYLNNLGDVVKWAYNESTKVGDVTVDSKLDRGLEPMVVDNSKTVKERLKEIKENSVDVIAVVRLKEVYTHGYLTLAQVRALPEYNFDHRVALEKKIEIQMARAEKLAKSCKNIQDVATSLNDSVVVIDSVSLASPTFGRFGMERKVQAMAALAKSNGLMGPIKGANGVYFVQSSNHYEMEQANSEQVRMGYEMNLHRSYGMMNAEYMHQNDYFYGRFSTTDNFYADWNVMRYLPTVMVFSNQQWIPLTRDCRLTQWLRSNAKVQDNRNQAY